MSPHQHSARPSWREELRESVTPRTVGMVVGTMLLALAFVFSYVAAFHQPTPHQIPIEVAVGGTGQAATTAVEQTVSTLNGLDGDPVVATAADTASTARQDVTDGTTSAALVVDPTGQTQAVLYVASGGGASVVDAVEQVVSGVADAQGTSYTVTDLVPVGDGDARGLTGFYLTVGWVVGGYLVASLLGVVEGARARTRRHAAVRLLMLVPYALVLGLGGALIVGPVLGAWTGHLWSLGLVGALTVFSVAAVTVGLQALLGTLGIGVAVLIFVVLGNPSAGGPFPADLLPAFWSAIGPYIPTGAATQLVRDTVYFGADGVGRQLWVLTGYLLAGVALAVGVNHADREVRKHRDSREPRAARESAPPRHLVG